MSAITLSRTMLAAVVLAVAVAVAGCGGDASSSSPVAAASTQPAPPTVSLSKDDVLFVQMMIPHHKDAVAMAELVATRTKNTDLLRLADQIKAAQTPEIETMTGWLQGAGKPTVAPNADTAHGPGEHAMPGATTFGAMTRLSEASGRKFERLFLTMMITHHRGAITASKAQSRHLSSPEAKTLAQKVISGQQAEVATMKKILAQIG